MPVDKLLVSEIFGPTLQGEGPSQGRRCTFLRLAVCNLKCTWCDTKYTWDWDNYDYSKETTSMTYLQILEKVLPTRSGMLVVSGGEPLLQQAKLVPLLFAIKDVVGTDPWRVEIETAGTITPRGDIVRFTDQFNVSPKLENSGNGPERCKMDTLEFFNKLDKTVFKFVIDQPDDVDEVDALVEALKIDQRKVFLMPQGTDRDELIQKQEMLAPIAIERGYNLTTRLHVMIWGNKRGK